jgi:hypothetical protein
MPRVRLRLELDPDVDLSNDDVRSSVLEGIQAQLREIAGVDLRKADAHVCGARKLPHRYPQALIEESTKSARAVFTSMMQEIHNVLAE